MGIVLHWVPKTQLLPSSVVVITQSFQTVVSLEVALLKWSGSIYAAALFTASK